jgi:hypothetical protein
MTTREGTQQKKLAVQHYKETDAGQSTGTIRLCLLRHLSKKKKLGLFANIRSEVFKRLELDRNIDDVITHWRSTSDYRLGQ